MTGRSRALALRAAGSAVRASGLVGLVVVAVACHDQSSARQPAGAAATVDPTTAGTIAVRVRYAGAAPSPQPLNMRSAPQCVAAHPEPVLDPALIVHDGALANAFVWIKTGLEGMRFPAPSAPVTIDQTGCMYVPHVAGVMVGQTVVFLNSDPEPHNVHGRPAGLPAWNFMTASPGASRSVTFDKSEVAVPVGCDIHPWMRGYLGVVAHPYFAVTPASGAVTLATVPPGTYTVAVWHETLGTQEQAISLPPSGAAQLEFVFPDDKT